MHLRRSSVSLFALLLACGSTSSPETADSAAEETPDASPAAPDTSAPADVAAPDSATADGPGADLSVASADAGVPTGASDAAPAVTGQYSCTLNASTPYHVGGEHKGYTMFGTVVDTTPGAGMARVGAIQSIVVASDLLVKWVWPGILSKGHTYELAVFEDHQKNRTCAGTATAEPQWLIKIPAVSGDFEFKWIQPVPHTASCQDFPPGPLP